MLAPLHLIVQIFFGVINLAFFAGFILSFLPLAPDHPLNRFVQAVIRPVYAPIQRRIPPIGFLNIAYIIAIWATNFVATLIGAALPSGW